MDDLSSSGSSTSARGSGPRAELAKVIPRRLRVSWPIGVAVAIGFALVVMPLVTAEQWLASGKITVGKPAPITVRVPPFAGFHSDTGQVSGGGVVLPRGEVPTPAVVDQVKQIEDARPHSPYFAWFLLVAVLAGVFVHHTRRSVRGRLVRVQVTSLAWIAATAVAVKVLLLATSISVLAVPVAVFAIVPTLVLDRVVGLATGTLAALVFAMLEPFDVGIAIVLLVQAGAAGLVVAERPKQTWRAAVFAGGIATVFTGATYLLLEYLTSGVFPVDELRDPLHSAWAAAVIGPALATVLSAVLVPAYQLVVGEITSARLVQLEDLSHPLLRQIAEKAPGTWQHSLTMANMAEMAANAIGANGRLVRVGAYYHDLGKSLQPKYFIENLEPGETSPHDRLPPEVSTDAIFAHVTEGIVLARRSGLHERIVDFMHMHHGNGVLEYFWAKCREQGNPRQLGIESFRYPGVPPQTRETAILAICDAVEAASRTLKKPEPQAIDNLVQRIVYGKLHLGQLDDSGLSMSDLRMMTESLRETIRHANHGRIEYPWQKAQQDASASLPDVATGSGPRLDSLDRPAQPEQVHRATAVSEEAVATTGVQTPKLRVGASGGTATSRELALQQTAPVPRLPEQDRSQRMAAPAPPPAPAPAPEPEYDTAPADAAPLVVRDTASGASIRPAEPAASAVIPLVAKKQIEPDAANTIGTRPQRPTAAEVRQFASDAATALDDTSKGVSALPREAADSGMRKRAATLPPVAPRRPPTMPPPFPPPGISDDTSTTQPRMIPPSDAASTQPRMGSEIHAASTQPRMPTPDSAWSRGLASRIDAAIEERDEWGAETPIVAPTKAELQALIGGPPDVTKKQSIEELERLHRASTGEHPRSPHQTAEVSDDDIEAAIELAPPARRGSIGVAKKNTKKPGEV